jgi:predicted DNA-binding protein (UPF0251 family)
MGRPRKKRFVWQNPVSHFFKSAGIRLSQTEHIILTVDEFEAIRLADLEGLYQEEAAKTMNVSRQTFGRIILEAHRKIAEYLLTGKSLKIEGGNYITGDRILYCLECKNIWDRGFRGPMPLECPECNNTAIQTAGQGGPFGRGPMRGRGRRRGGPPWR